MFRAMYVLCSDTLKIKTLFSLANPRIFSHIKDLTFFPPAQIQLMPSAPKTV